METRTHQPTIRPVLIAGLGNPGEQYAHNRHNIGFLVVDELARLLNTTWSDKPSWNGQVAQAGSGVYLLKPNTFMNDSGRAVGAVAQYFGIPASHIYVIYDDRDLPFGSVRYTKGFRTGARHNGVRSVASHVKGDFHRFRFGVGNDQLRHKVMHEFVLENFNGMEQKKLGHYIDVAIANLRAELNI